MATIIRVNGALQPMAPECADGTLTLEGMQAAVGGPVGETSVVDEEGLLEREKPATYVIHVWEEALPQLHPEIPQNWATSRLNGRPLNDK